MSQVERAGEYFDRMPVYKPGDKTAGILVAADRDVELISGKDGPAKAIPLKNKGYDGYTRTHTEGHASAFMTLNGITQARLYINNPRICPNCERNLSKMLAPGSQLEIVLPDGSMRVFVGRAQ